MSQFCLQSIKHKYHQHQYKSVFFFLSFFRMKPFFLFFFFFTNHYFTAGYIFPSNNKGKHINNERHFH